MILHYMIASVPRISCNFNFGAHPASCPMGTMGSFPGGKAAGA